MSDSTTLGAHPSGTPIVYFDTASTGQWKWRNKDRLAREQPDMMRLAWWHTADPLPACYLIKPPFPWNIEADAYERHGIDAMDCTHHGVDIRQVLLCFSETLSRSDFVYAYGADHHRHMIERSMLQQGMSLTWPRAPICLMREATPYVRKPRMQPGGGYAWPKFGEAFMWATQGMEMAPITPRVNPVSRGSYLVGCVRKIHESIVSARG